METYDCDLHIHGLHARGVSKHMRIARIAEQAKLKGLDVVGTGDLLHQKWFNEVKAELVEDENGVFRHKEHGTAFILSTEIESKGRVHHVLFYPDFAAAEEHRRCIANHCGDIDADGRPKIYLNSEELAKTAEDVGALIGPAHAFTPYFAMLAHHDSVAQCYGEMTDYVSFVELGLSADSYFADKIPELRKYVFLSNSDSHSPWPHRLGREFNRIRMASPTFSELKKALANKDGRAVVMNAGFNPREGKYHASGCNRCYQVFSAKQRLDYRQRCPLCSASIKKGVRDRIEELGGESISPEFRPPYTHIIPLAEIIAKTIGIKGVTSSTVQAVWKKFVQAFGSEIKVLIDIPFDELEGINAEVANSVQMFRQGKTIMLAGRGGQYGELIIPKNDADFEEKQRRRIAEIEGYYIPKDKKLTDYF